MALGLAGCLGPDPSLDAAYPGGSAVYEGSDGSRLTVEVKGVEMRYDAFLRLHESLILEIDYTFPEKSGRMDGPFVFEEAIDLAEGRIVQQVARCGFALPTPWPNGPVTCHDDRATVSFGASGLPGAFGAAPFWMGNEQRSWPVVDRSSGGQLEMSEDQDEVPKDCWRHTTRILEGHAGRIRALPWTALNTSFTRCPDQAFPVEFEPGHALSSHLTLTGDGSTPEKPVYRLLAAEPAAPPEGRSAPSAWNEPSEALPLHPVKDRAVPFQGPDLAQFPVEEAHASAMDMSDRYRDLHEDDGVLVNYHHRKGGSGEMFSGLREWDRYEVTLAAIGSNGGVEVVLEKRVDKTAGMQDSSVSITSEMGFSSDGLPVVLDRGSTLEDAMPLAKTLTGADENKGINAWHHPIDIGPSANWARLDGRAMREEGYELQVRFQPPGHQSGSGIGGYYPYRFVADGANGAVISFEVQHERLPLGPGFFPDG